jgi:glycosyltransferase involved in cell wall biosynthesis
VTDIIAISHACVTATNRAIYRQLAGLGWDLELVIPESLNNLNHYFRNADPPEPGDPPIHFLPLRGSNQRLHHYPGLVKLLEARRPKIVFVDSDPGAVVTLTAGLWARRRGAHVICQSNENLERRLSDRLRQGLYKRAARDVGIAGMIAVARAVVDHIFVLSDDGWKVTEGLGFKGKVSKIPVGFDPAAFVPDAAARERTRQELGLHELTIAYFGRQIPEKGVHLLIEALATMMDRPWQFLLDKFAETKDPYSERLIALLEKTGVGSRTVHFDAAHKDMPRFMNAADGASSTAALRRRRWPAARWS